MDPDIWRVHLRFARTHAPDDLRVLVEHYLPLARRAADQFRCGRTPSEDLRQVACEALVRALHRFDTERAVPFAGFFRSTVDGALKRYLRDVRWSVRLPRPAHDLWCQIRRTTELAEQELGREPTTAEVASRLGVSVDEVRAARRAGIDCDVSSLDVLADRGAASRPGALATCRDLELAEHRHALRQLLSLATERERELLDRYYVRGWSQARIAENLGVSQMQVSRELRGAAAHLRSHLPSG